MLLAVSVSLVSCGNETGEGGANASVNPPSLTIEDEAGAVQKVDAEDAIARVGSETITFSQINTMLNSSAMVGLSVPALGTPERNQVIITLLDKAISANLLYLDAMHKGVNTIPLYTREMNQFEEAVLSSLYKDKILIGDIAVTEDEINAYYKEAISQDVELTDDVKFAIESKVRKQKLQASKADLRSRIRDGISVSIIDDITSSDYDAGRKDNDIVAGYQGKGIENGVIVWRDIKLLMQGAEKRATNSAFFVDSEEERLQRLNRVIDTRIMAAKARQAGLESDPVFISRTREYHKTRLINLHRGGLVHNWMPTDEQLSDFYVQNVDRIAVPEARKIQMVLLETEAEAVAIKHKIENGDITMYQAAQLYSMDPNAKRTLGEMGWVDKDTGFPKLDEVTFNLEIEAVSDPVQSPAGWHLVKVLDIRDAMMQDIDDPQARNKTLRLYMKQKLNEYVVSLRRESYDVAVFDAQLQKYFQQEADMIALLSDQSKQEGSVTQQRLQDLQKWLGKN